MNPIKCYVINKSKLKVLKNKIEIYQNDYYCVGPEVCNNKLKVLKSEYKKLKELVGSFDNIYNELSEGEKNYINDRYFKGVRVKEIEEYYYNNIEKISLISPYKTGYNKKPTLNTIHMYLWQLNVKILNKFSVLSETTSRPKVWSI